LTDLVLIWKIFDSSRIKNLNKAFERGTNLNV